MPLLATSPSIFLDQPLLTLGFAAAIIFHSIQQYLNTCSVKLPGLGHTCYVLLRPFYIRWFLIHRVSYIRTIMGQAYVHWLLWGVTHHLLLLDSQVIPHLCLLLYAILWYQLHHQKSTAAWAHAVGIQLQLFYFFRDVDSWWWRKCASNYSSVILKHSSVKTYSAVCHFHYSYAVVSNWFRLQLLTVKLLLYGVLQLNTMWPLWWQSIGEFSV